MQNKFSNYYFNFECVVILLESIYKLPFQAKNFEVFFILFGRCIYSKISANTSLTLNIFSSVQSEPNRTYSFV